MLTIDNVETLDDYSAELTLESRFGGRLVYLVANESAVARFRPLVPAAGVQTAEYGAELTLTPQSSFIDKISGVQFRSAVAGSPARVVASLSEPGDILPASGTPFTGVLAASGAVVGAVGVLDRSTSLVTIENTLVEIDVYSFAIPAATMAADSILRLKILGDYLHNNAAANTATWRVMLGGTTLHASLSDFGNAINAARQPLLLEVLIANLGSVSSQMMVANLSHPPTNIGAPPTGIGSLGVGAIFPKSLVGGIGAPAAIDMAVAQTLAVSLQWGVASLNNSLRKRYALLELL